MFHLAQLPNVASVGTKTWPLSVVIVGAAIMVSCCWDNNQWQVMLSLVHELFQVLLLSDKTWPSSDVIVGQKHDYRVMLLSDKNMPIEWCYYRNMWPSSVVAGKRIMSKFRCWRDKKHGQVLLLRDNNHGHVLWWEQKSWSSVVIVRTRTMAKCC